MNSEIVKAGAPANWAPHQEQILHKDGIKRIQWAGDKTGKGIDVIETEDGQTFFPDLESPPLPAWVFLLPASYPVLGFFIAWGLIRAVGWAVAGFSESSN